MKESIQGFPESGIFCIIRRWKDSQDLIGFNIIQYFFASSTKTSPRKRSRRASRAGFHKDSLCISNEGTPLKPGALRAPDFISISFDNPTKHLFSPARFAHRIPLDSPLYPQHMQSGSFPARFGAAFHTQSPCISNKAPHDAQESRDSNPMYSISAFCLSKCWNASISAFKMLKCWNAGISKMLVKMMKCWKKQWEMLVKCW